jgi:hypothetical protein
LTSLPRQFASVLSTASTVRKARRLARFFTRIKSTIHYAKSLFMAARPEFELSWTIFSSRAPVALSTVSMRGIGQKSVWRISAKRGQFVVRTIMFEFASFASSPKRLSDLKWHIVEKCNVEDVGAVTASIVTSWFW